MLALQGTIDPGPGIATYYGSAALDVGGNIGFTYMESSSNEYPSMYVTGLVGGTLQPGIDVAPGTSFLDGFFRAGDYSSVAVDPTNGGTFWAANEYKGDAFWNTAVASFSFAPSVIASNPAAGQIVTGPKPTTFSLTFSQSIDPSSINAGDFTVNGTGADSASLSGDGLTITYSYNTSPVSQEGNESMSLPAGAVKGAGNEFGNSAFSATFQYVVQQLQVTTTSPAVGSVLPAGVTDLIVHFNKNFDVYSIQTSDFQLSQGSVVSAVPLTRPRSTSRSRE